MKFATLAWSVTLGLCGMGLSLIGQEASAPPMTRLSEVKALSPNEAGEARPVRIQAVVTYSNQEWPGCMIHDDGAGCYVGYLSESSDPFVAGDLVEVAGITVRGDFAPSIGSASIKKLGVGAFPEPAPLDRSRYSLRSLDNQWVWVEGVIRGIAMDGPYALVSLQTETERYAVRVDGHDARMDSGALLDSTARIHAVCGMGWNFKNQFVQFELKTPGPEHIQVLKPSQSAPFSRPLLAMGDALQVQFDFSGANRVRVEGVVTYQGVDGTFYIQDSTGEFFVNPVKKDGLPPGTRVEAAGYATAREFSPTLEDALVRPMGRGESPAPERIALNTNITASADCRLIAVTGTLAGLYELPEERIFQMKSNDVTFRAHLKKRSGGQTQTAFREGALLRLTGVARVESGPDNDATSFDLYLRSPGDIDVLNPGPYWTVKKAFTALGTTSALFLCVLLVSLSYQARARDRYARLFENANDLIFAFRPDGTFLYFNHAMTEASGYRREELAMRQFWKLVSDTSRDRLRPLVDGLKAGETSQTMEFKMKSRAGEALWLEATFRKNSGRRAADLIEVIARNVSERKQTETQLEQTERVLRDAARKAGMSEIASGVLHNVGNVLNSVNVSTTVIAQKLRRLPLDRIDKVAKLVEETIALSSSDSDPDTDPEGKAQKLAPYLNKLSEHLAKERGDLLEEIQSLVGNIEHVKEVVNMQQSYARLGGCVETLPIQDILEDAIRLNMNSLTRHQIEIRKQLEAVPPFTLDKHKTLQILVNLIRNAKEACQAAETEEKIIRIRLFKKSPATIRVEVEDNGVGILEGHQVQIFNHGFTTKPTGHGFGLHSCANFAKEMDGRLDVRSDGAGKGAVFGLELPFA